VHIGGNRDVGLQQVWVLQICYIFNTLHMLQRKIDQLSIEIEIRPLDCLIALAVSDRKDVLAALRLLRLTFIRRRTTCEWFCTVFPLPFDVSILTCLDTSAFDYKCQNIWAPLD
jgi:hypothetical protein